MFFACLVFYYWLPGMLCLTFLNTKDARIPINILEISLGHGSFIWDTRDHFHSFRSCFQALLGGLKPPCWRGFISSPVWEDPSEFSNQWASRYQVFHLGCGNEPLLNMGLSRRDAVQQTSCKFTQVHPSSGTCGLGTGMG